MVRGTANQLGRAGREGGGGPGGAGWSLSDEERIGVVTDLVELFQQVDHNGDQASEKTCQTSTYPPTVVKCNFVLFLSFVSREEVHEIGASL